MSPAVERASASFGIILIHIGLKRIVLMFIPWEEGEPFIVDNIL
jgi:hypothetical protein